MQRSLLSWLIGAVLIAATWSAPGYALDKAYNYFKSWTNSGVLADSNFFPIAVWLQTPSFATQYKNMGVNVFVGLPGGSSLAELATLRAYGMKTICDQSTDAKTVMNNANYKAILLGWMHQDEPDNAQANGSGGYDPCISPSTIVSLYNGWKAADATRPILLNFGQGVANINWVGRGTCSGNWQMYPQYMAGLDIASYDVYPVNDGYTFTWVAKGVDSLRSWCNNAKPVWCWIECTDIGDGGGPKPTPAQVKSEVWMGLIAGANGFGYFCHSFVTGATSSQAVLGDAAMLPALTTVDLRIQSLAPILNSTTVNNVATVNNANIRRLVKQFGGGTFVFAENMQSGAASGTFTVTNPPATTVTVLDENRTINLSGTQFTDAFTGYGVHLYQIGGAPLSDIKPAKTVVDLNKPVDVVCYPNPVKSFTNIFMDEDQVAGSAVVTICMVTGQKVRSLTKISGQVLTWDGKNELGQKVPEGFYTITVEGRTAAAVKPILVLK